MCIETCYLKIRERCPLLLTVPIFIGTGSRNGQKLYDISFLACPIKEISKRKERQLVKIQPVNVRKKAMKLPKFLSVSLGFHNAFLLHLTCCHFKRA